MANKVSVVINGKEFVSPEAKKAGDSLTTLGKVATKAGKVTEMAFKAAVAGIVAVAAVAKKAIEEAADMETIAVSFDVLIGNAEKAKKVIADLRAFSASTPLQFADIAKGAQNLMAFGIEADDVRDKMEMLGNVSMGNTAKLESVVRAYGKIQAKGKASLEELNMITEAGIPIMKELASQYNVTGEEMFKLISAGTVGFADVDKALQAMTASGGQFEGMLERQSETASGLFSTLKDNISITLAEIGDVLLPDIKKILVEITEVVKKMQGSTELRNTVVAVSDIAKMTGKAIYHSLVLVGSSVKQIFDLIRVVFSADFWEYMGTNMWSWFREAGKSAILALKSLLVAVGSVLWEPLKLGFNLVVDGIKIAFQNMANFFIGGINAMFDGIYKAYNKIRDIFGRDEIVFGDTIKLVSDESLNLSGSKIGDAGKAISDAFKIFNASWSNFVSDFRDASDNSSLNNNVLFSAFSDNMGILFDNFLKGLKGVIDFTPKKSFIPSLNVRPFGTTSGGGAGTVTDQGGGYSRVDRSGAVPWKGLTSEIEKLIGGFAGLIEPLASVQALLDPVATILGAMMEVLGPVINEVLDPLVGILKILGQVLGAVLAPAIKILSPIIEAISRAFVWLYNNAIVPLANGIIWVLNSLRTGVTNFVNGFIDAINFMFGWLGVNIPKLVAPGRTEGFISPIDVGDLSTSGSDFAGGGVGSSTSIQSLNIVVKNIFQGNVIGDGGMEAVGEYVVDAIKKFAGSGGNVEVISA